MTRDCGCSGTCGEVTPALPRREFLHTLAVSAAGVALVGADAHRVTALPRLPERGDEPPPQTPRTYSGEHLEYVLMPIGGLGTGTVWLDGQGRLAVWQIFNNFTEMRVPDSFLAVRAQAAGGEPVARVLQTVAEGGLRPMRALTFEGGYPIARLRFEDDALPVEVMLEAYNPLLPLDADSSSLPCAVFRVTVANPGPAPVDVTLLATAQNAVGGGGAGNPEGVRHAGYGRNTNAIARGAGWTVAHLGQDQSPPEDGPLTVRDAAGREQSGPPLVWLSQLGGLGETAADPRAVEVLEAVRPMLEAGGGAVIARASGDFWRSALGIRRQQAEWDAVRLFADFDGDDYGDWRTEGEAFGARPSRGTEGGQQRVSGFLGRGLVNTFIAGDGPQGTLTSPTFTIEQRYLGFLIGGGAHAGQTCLNLVVGGQVARTATGRNNERLEPASWDLEELLGQEARLQIVDRSSDPWGHVNVDHIVFSDLPPETLFRLRGPLTDIVGALPARYEAVRDEPGPRPVELTPAGRALLGQVEPWTAGAVTILDGLEAAPGVVVLATAGGAPALLELRLGQARWIVGLADGLPWSWAEKLLVAARGEPLGEGWRLITGSTRYGTMALACDRPCGGTAAWTAAAELTAPLLVSGEVNGPDRAGPSPTGETINAALAPRLTLAPGASETVTFALTWHFPNVERFGHRGNAYSRRFADAAAVAEHLLRRLPELWGWTERYHRTVYQSNLPAALLDAFTSQSVIARGPTCFWTESGYFAGFEGCYGCCPLNCTHVWNYAQTHARLWPEIDRNLRRSDLVTYLLETGETQHRQHSRHGAFVDGHCAVIEGCLRAHQTSADDAFLRDIWPHAKRAMEWLIRTFDAGEEGSLAGHQWNTYDCATSGQHTFCGSQYLSALAACARMATVVGDTAAAERFDALRRRGSAAQDERMWHNEYQYYIQLPGTPAAHDYNTGCHSDQLLGQWWAHLLDLGYLYPEGRVRAALTQIVRHNFRAQFRGFQQAPRRYVLDDEPGLLMCSWPYGGRPDPFIIYADEIWTGIEYEVAGLLIFEGLVDEGLRLVEAARGRYDGRRRETLNSGPGGDPFNELECGKFYARAMSSGGLIQAAQGLVLDGPAGILGLVPRWQPHDHRSFFLAAEGWGLFTQTIAGGAQTERIEVRYGRLELTELQFVVAGRPTDAEVTIDGRRVPGRVGQDARGRTVVRLPERITAGSTVEVRFGA